MGKGVYLSEVLRGAGKPQELIEGQLDFVEVEAAA